MAPSTLAVVGRYVLTPDIFRCLEHMAPGVGGEIQLTDGIRALLRDQRVSALQFAGKRFDCGSKLGNLAATLHFGLKHPEVGSAFTELVRQHGEEIERGTYTVARSLAA